MHRHKLSVLQEGKAGALPIKVEMEVISRQPATRVKPKRKGLPNMQVGRSLIHPLIAMLGPCFSLLH